MPASKSNSEEFSQLERDEALTLISRGLAEDAPAGDVTSEILIPAEVSIRSAFSARRAGVLCGLPVVEALFQRVDPALSLFPSCRDGDLLAAGDAFLAVEGNARSLLLAERLALNFLQRLSGVATGTRRIVDALADTSCKLYDTRKTTPGWRQLEKYAVRVGGGENHRRDLSEFPLVKDNHRALLNWLEKKDMRDWLSRLRKSCSTVELEIDTLDELGPALEAGPDILLLDNFSLKELRVAVKRVKEAGGKRPLLEASGGIGAETARAVAETGVDRVALGAITHSAPALDIGLDLVKILE